MPPDKDASGSFKPPHLSIPVAISYERFNSVRDARLNMEVVDARDTKTCESGSLTQKSLFKNPTFHTAFHQDINLNHGRFSKLALSDCEAVIMVNLLVAEEVWRAIQLNKQAN